MKQVQELLAKQMTRREFVRLFGLMILGVLGVSNFISLLKGSISPGIAKKSDARLQGGETSGFGTRKFGA